jgi:hypothetical protein
VPNETSYVSGYYDNMSEMLSFSGPFARPCFQPPILGGVRRFGRLSRSLGYIRCESWRPMSEGHLFLRREREGVGDGDEGGGGGGGEEREEGKD